MLNCVYKMHFITNRLSTLTYQFTLLCFSSLMLFSFNLSAQTHFSEARISQIIKSVGMPTISVVQESQRTNNLITPQTRYNFQSDPFAPFSLTFSNNQLIIEWLLPQAKTKQQYKTNAENQRLAKNVIQYLFGDDRLLRDLNESNQVHKNLRSISGYDVEAIRNGIQFTVRLNKI